MSEFLTSVRAAGPVREVDASTVLTPAPAEPDATAGADAMHPEPLEEVSGDLRSHHPRDFAMLVVTRAGSEEFRIRGQHCDAEHVLRSAERFGRPHLPLGDLAQKGGLDPQDLDDLLFEWSRIQPADLVDWLQGLRARIGDTDLRLVIWDSTGFDIPWEAFTLPPDQDRSLPGGPLGAFVAVTRLIVRPGQGPDRADEEVVAAGAVLSYVDEETADLDILERYGRRPLDAGPLLTLLEAGDEHVGLVYVGCHGTWSTDVLQLRLGPWKLSKISRSPLSRLKASRSLVFLNACHSGRLLADAVTGGSPARTEVFGFAEAFLRQGAGTVIGPTGPVDRRLARRVALAVFEQVAADPDKPVAAALRDARAAVGQGVVGVRDPREEDLKAFLYSCMYVCYGSPYTRLQLREGAAS